MRIFYIHQYFKTPEEGGAIRSYYLAKGMVDHGYEVEMIAGHDSPRYAFKIIDGIKVHYLPVAYDNAFGFVRRIWSFFRFARKAYALAKSLPKADFCYASSTPLTVAWVARKLKKHQKIPYIFEVRDLWPEAPIQVGAIKNAFVKRILYAFEKETYQQADKIIALSPGIRNGIEEKISGKPIAIIPNMADLSLFRPTEKKAEHLEHFGLSPETFVVSYFGAIGKINRLENLLDMAKACQDMKAPVHFFIVGKGAEKNSLMEKAKALSLKNLAFLPFQNKFSLSEWLSVSDASYISFDDFPILQSNSPNKFFDSLAAGKIIFCNQEGWIKDLSLSHQCGLYLPAGQAVENAKELMALCRQPEKIRQMKLNAREMAELYFDKDLQVKKLIKAFENEIKWESEKALYHFLTA